MEVKILKYLNFWNLLAVSNKKNCSHSFCGSRYRLETFFAEEENHTRAPRWASNLWPLHVNVEILSRSPQETDDFTGMLENDEIKHKI